MRLIKFTSKHYELLGSWFTTEAEITQWGGPNLPCPLTHSGLKMIHENFAAPYLERLFWMAEEDGKLVGHIQLGIDRQNGNARIFRVAIAPSERGKGFSIPMLRLVVDEGFNIPDIQRVDLNVYAFNEPAIKAYTKVGFINEGTRRSFTKVGSQRWDNTMMGLLRDEWPSPYTSS